MEPGLPGAGSSAKTSPAQAASPGTQGKGQVQILQHIQLQIQDGEFMVLVGPSGCGKSTLLRLIAGLDTPTAGQIRVGDRLVNDLAPKARDIAMVFQSYALYPHMTVYDNLAFGLRRTGFKGLGAPKGALPGQQWAENALMVITRKLPRSLRYQSARERAIAGHVQQVAGMLQIEGLLKRFPKELSGGQKQRVALGRAMARNPQVFLMDEPLSNLDAKLRAQTRAQIVRLQKQLGTTTIYVTHDQTEAMTMGDRIAVMNAGVIQQLATPLELYNRPANRFVAAFIGSPPMNFLRMQVKDSQTLSHRSFQLHLPEFQAHLGQRLGQWLDLGVRPEHMDLASEAEAHLPIEVELVEALGHETFIRFSLGAGEVYGEEGRELFHARITPDHEVHLGDRLHLRLQFDKLHFFEAQSGQALPWT